MRAITGLPGSLPAVGEAGPRFVAARFSLAEQADRLVALYREVAAAVSSSGRARVRTSVRS